MPYSKNQFIIPLSDTDTSVKLRNNTGAITYTLNDDYSIATIEQNNIVIKQKSDTRKIILDFPNATEASGALALLDAAIGLLKINLKNKQTASSIIIPKPYQYPQHDVVVSDIWGQTESMSQTAPVSNTSLVEIVTDLQLNIVSGTYSFTHANLYDVISPLFGDGSYIITLKTADDISIPIGWKEWYVDLDRNLLIFPEGLSSNGPIKVDANNLPKISFYRYIGLKGLASISHDNYLNIVVDNDGDTVFDLGLTPANVYELYINGLRESSDSYNVVSNILTWTGTYDLEASDELILVYN